MDELFKQAAAGYPLKTDSGDWDSLASRLLTTPVSPASGKKKNKFNKYGLPLLLVALLLGVGGGPLKQSRNHVIDYFPSAVRDDVNTGKGAVLLNPKTTTTKQPRSQRQLINETAFLPETDFEPATGNSMPGDNNLYNNRIISDYRRTADAGVDNSARKNVMTIDAPDLTYNTERSAIASKITSAGTSLPLTKTMDEAPGTMEKKTDTIQRPFKIYWGIVFGPGINRVKKQKLQRPGFDFGIIAGISILKGKASVETGLLYTQKYYFSEGKYFNMDKAGGSMPQGMEVMSLEGSSRLFELPVKFKYKVLQKKRSGIFMSTGISSYLMTKEENDYLTMMNGSEQSMFGSYKDNSRYIAVMANIGAEYNYKIGKHTLIRVEPYVQIPLKGIGIGSMPVMTTGLHFGFMRFAP